MNLMLVFLTVVFVNVASGQTNEFKFESLAIHKLIQSEGWSCQRIVQYFLERAFKYDPNLRSIISYNPRIFERAQQLDTFYSANKKLMGKLHCVPMIIKDNIDIAGIPTTAGVNPLRYSIPSKNALVVDRLDAEGAIFLGKANMAQLAVGAIYESDQVGLCQNPYDFGRTCSGSSSGSGASVAGRLAVISLGTDTGGSIIGPASFNGVFGLRPPHRTDNLEGVLPFYPRLDTIGPFATKVDDVIMTHSIISNQPSIYENSVVKSFNAGDLKVRVITNFMKPFKVDKFEFVIDPIIQPIITEGLNRLKKTGVQVLETTLSDADLENWSKTLDDLIQVLPACSRLCLPYQYNKYFGDNSRYPPGSPVKNFKSFYESPTLNSFWKDAIKEGASLGLDLNKLDGIEETRRFCERLCQPFEQRLPNYVQLVNDKIMTDDFDALFIPSITFPAPLHKDVNKILVEPQQDTLSSLSIYTGYGFLVMPSDFTPASSSDPDGLPAAMALVFKDKKSENAFKVARLYERTKSVVKLPFTVPLLKYSSNKASSINYSASILQFVSIISIFLIEF